MFFSESSQSLVPIVKQKFLQLLPHLCVSHATLMLVRGAQLPYQIRHSRRIVQVKRLRRRSA